VRHGSLFEQVTVVRSPHLPLSWTRSKLQEYVVRSLSDVLSRNDGSTVDLWDHQHETIVATRDRLVALGGSASGVAVIPTGGGKTEVFEYVVNAVSRVTTDGKRVTPNTVVLVPTRQLVAQTAHRLIASYPHLSGVVGVLGTDLPPDVTGIQGVRPVTIATYDWFVRSVVSGALAVEDVHLLIMDEAHRALSDLRQDVFKPFINERLTIAFSATPSFDETKSLCELFPEDCEIVNISAQRLREDGIIAPVVNYVLHVSINGEMAEDPVLAARPRPRPR
jgi:superfamily II DNA or RNA helicase